MTHSYKDDFYSHVSKQFEPQNPKPYQKRKVNGQMTFDDVDGQYAEAISKERKSYAEKFRQYKQENREWQQKTKGLTEQEIEVFFWDRLVQVGWKLSSEEDFDKKRLIFPCDECDEILSTVSYKFMTIETIYEMAKSTVLSIAVQQHKAFCKAISKVPPKRSNQ